jgi:hypothetical protein
MARVARIGDGSVGSSDRRLVAGFNCWHEFRGRDLHCRDQLIDMIAGREDLGFDLAFCHI